MFPIGILKTSIYYNHHVQQCQVITKNKHNISKISTPTYSTNTKKKTTADEVPDFRQVHVHVSVIKLFSSV